ncbi:hypothetical protein MASR1M29_16230 [Cloacibacterium normanense]
MKRFFLIFVLSLFSITSYTQSLSGKVRDTLNIRKYDRVQFEIKLKKINSEKEYFSTSDMDGNFRFSNIENGDYQFTINNEFYDKNIFLIKINGDTSLNIFVKKFCQYHENKTSVCPKCKSSEKVVPIFYGLTTLDFMKKNKKKYHFAGCELSYCMPNWYCKRDRLEF